MAALPTGETLRRLPGMAFYEKYLQTPNQTSGTKSFRNSSLEIQRSHWNALTLLIYKAEEERKVYSEAVVLILI